MINNFSIKNFGPISQVIANELGNINLLIGKNGCGKTFLLKTLHRRIQNEPKYQCNSLHFFGDCMSGLNKISKIEMIQKQYHLNKESIIFIDNPDSSLHPSSIVMFIDLIVEMAKSGTQFFLASHSYFVLKKLFVVAQAEKIKVSLISGNNGEWAITDLKEEMPENSIINESIELYKKELEICFGGI